MFTIFKIQIFVCVIQICVVDIMIMCRILDDFPVKIKRIFIGDFFAKLDAIIRFRCNSGSDII